MTYDGILETRLLSSLSKVFSDEEIKDKEWNKGSMLSNEVYSFQAAYKWSGRNMKNISISIESELAPWITIRKVGLIPSEMPCHKDHDENVLRVTPGLYPDSLIPLNVHGIPFLPYQWRSVWITIKPEGKVMRGTYPIKISFHSKSGDKLGDCEFQMELISALLPKQTLICSEWLHTDCIATWYKINVFSEEYWKQVDQYIKTAVEHGINMILTPLFTPPIDTAVGGERPTVQLVEVNKTGDSYAFGFDRLKRWLDLCRANGVEYFEFSHLFTQWGAKHAPKIIANENMNEERIFGWDTDAAGNEYSSFLDSFLPQLVSFIKKEGIEDCCYFHVSDEPSLEQFEAYKAASDIMKKHLKDFPLIDALSDYEFYEKGIVKEPVPAADHIEPFLENNVENLWTYYCILQDKKVTNRFFNMPSARNRILGIQLYKFKLKGFLHWGYNFWYSYHSLFPINPYRETDAGYLFPSGDAYLVYPGEDGPIESLRMEVFYEALQDIRALTLLEEKIGREAVMEFLDAGLEKPITFSEYPKEQEWLLSKREQLNRLIADKCENGKR